MTPFENLRETCVEKHRNRITVIEDDDGVKAFFRNVGTLHEKQFRSPGQGRGFETVAREIDGWIDELTEE